MAQDVAELTPRVRRALEGVKALEESDPARLTDDQVEAAAADAIGDLILYTGGAWGKIIEIAVDVGSDPIAVTLVATVPANQRYLVGIGTGGAPVIVWGDIWEDPAPGGVADPTRRTVVDSIEATEGGFAARATATPDEPVRLAIHATITLVSMGDQAYIAVQNPDADQMYGQSDLYMRPTAQHFTVTPELSFAEQGLVAAQAALNYFFHVFRDQKISERHTAEGREWEWSQSANLLRDAIKLLKEQRDAALAGLESTVPALARAASFLAVRDPVTAALIEPYVDNGAGLGGQALLPPGYQG